MQYQNVQEMLGEPVSPQVRAAALKVFARIHNIRMKPGARTPEGRVGTAVWVDEPHFGGITIIDPSTGTLLGYEVVGPRPSGGLPAGTVWSYDAIRSWWTNRLPY
jgi:hypothetical protein